MIIAENLEKNFDKVTALADLNLNVKKGSIYGLVGTNGAGKTTALKHITGILKADGGTVKIDGENVYENINIKKRLGFIPDDLSFFSIYNLNDAARLYRALYPSWNEELFSDMTKKFDLDIKRKMSKFSKGMQKQAAFALTMAARPDFLILDEPIDGLDPIVRKLVWKYIVDAVAEREMTVLVSSHNLREMEGICDSIGILANGRMVIERDLDELKSDIHKIQVAFKSDDGSNDSRFAGLDILHRESRGTVELLIVRNRKDVVESIIGASNPVIFDLLPLSLEEIFIYELGGKNSELDSILF